MLFTTPQRPCSPCIGVLHIANNPLPSIRLNGVLWQSRSKKISQQIRHVQPLQAASTLGSNAPDLMTDVEEIEKVLDSSPVTVVTFVATWCRKCIFLKPKLAKLIAEEFGSIPLVLVDVNAVPGSFIQRVGVTKMPTIQLWHDGNKIAEVIGGHSGPEVVAQVRDMIVTGRSPPPPPPGGDAASKS